jgi:hypothetical protein
MADKTQDCSTDQVSPELTSRELLNELLKAPGREPQPVHPAADAQAADGAAGPIERVMDHWTESVSRLTGGTSARCKLYAFALVDCHRKGSKGNGKRQHKATLNSMADRRACCSSMRFTVYSPLVLFSR